jgi:hypothetical protein
MIDTASRYAGLPPLIYTPADGKPIVYLSRRFVPQPDSMASQGKVAVQQSDFDRLDLIAARTLRNSELFWRIADANAAMNPFHLTLPAGRMLRIPVPQV